MITISDVSQGTKALYLNAVSSTRYTKENIPVKTRYNSVVLVAGLNDRRSSQVDLGYLRQGDIVDLGQKDVEHFDFKGELITKGIESAVHQTYPGDGTAVPCLRLPFVEVPVVRGSYSASYYAQTILCNADRTGASAIWSLKDSLSSKVFVDYCFSTMSAWIDAVTLFQGYCLAHSDATLGWSMSGYIYRFNGDFSKQSNVFWSSPTSKAIPLNASWDEYLDAYGNDIRLKSLSLTPSSAMTGVYGLRQGSAYRVEDVALSRSVTKEEIFPEDLTPHWGDLATDCYDQISLWSGNGGAYVRDMLQLSSAAKETVSLVKDIALTKNPVAAAKDIASLFLSFRYGWVLSAKDTCSLVQADYDRLYRNGRAKRSSSRIYTRNGTAVVARMAVYCRPYANVVSDLVRWLKLMDFYPTWENLWDLVPFSFVVDWFTGIGDVLHRSDLLRDRSEHDISLTGFSIKTSVVLGSAEKPLFSNAVGTVMASYYKRWYSTLPINPSVASYASPSKSGFTHWLEGTALIVQRIR